MRNLLWFLHKFFIYIIHLLSIDKYILITCSVIVTIFYKVSLFSMFFGFLFMFLILYYVITDIMVKRRPYFFRINVVVYNNLTHITYDGFGVSAMMSEKYNAVIIYNKQLVVKMCPHPSTNIYPIVVKVSIA